VAHGSSDPQAAAAVTSLIGVVRARASCAGLRGLQVQAAYLGHALPSVPDVLEALHGTETPCGYDGEQAAVVLPLLLTGAYHSGTDLPAVLRQVSGRLPGLRISYGRVLGPHPLLLRALERRLAEAGTPGPGHALTSDTAVVLAAAGSSRPAANAAVARAAQAWQSARGWRAVVPAYASAASPTPGQAVTALLRAGAPRVLVATYVLAPGRFADQVRESSLAAGADIVSAPLAAAPEVADVIIQRYREVTAALPRPAADPARAMGPSVS
jgi:sirohydrochlorin ferrochelatase